MPPVQFGKYQLLRKLASGGMAELFLARREGPMEFSKQVVIKRILPELSGDPEFVRTFLNEGRLAALLHHPSVVSVSELGEVGGQYYIEMEYIEGENLQRLAQLLNKQGLKFTPRDAATVMAHVAEGLAHAHGLKAPDGKALCLVHRDVSLENILISVEGNVKLVDFGLAKAAALASRTQAGLVKGKVSYLSPEQALSRTLDGRSDIFSLGVTLYFLMTGVPPFRGQNDQETLRNVINANPRPPSQIAPGLPRQLETIILTALKKEPGDRFPNASAMAAALQAFAVAQPRGLVLPPELARLVAGALREPGAAAEPASGKTEVSPALIAPERVTGSRPRPRAKPSAPRPRPSRPAPAPAAGPPEPNDTAAQPSHSPKRKPKRASLAWVAGTVAGLLAGTGALVEIVRSGALPSSGFAGTGAQATPAPEPVEQPAPPVPQVEAPPRPAPVEVRRPSVKPPPVAVKSPAAAAQPAPPVVAAPAAVEAPEVAAEPEPVRDVGLQPEPLKEPPPPVEPASQVASDAGTPSDVR